MLNCFDKKNLEEIRKECGVGQITWQDLRSTHGVRQMIGRGCKQCEYREYCIKNPEVMIYLNDRCPVYNDIDDGIIYSELVSRRKQITELKKVVKELKQVIKDINEELKDNGETET